MNILDIQNKLKNFSEEQLVQEMQAPTGNAPQFLVLSEIQRRKRMRDDLQQQQAQPVKTVAEEAIAAGGVPQGGIGQLAGAMGQGSSNAQMPQQQAPEQQPQGMYGGGIVKLAPGGAVGGGWKPSRMSIVDVGNGKVNIVDENGGLIHGPLPFLFAQELVNEMNAKIDADEATGAAQQPATPPTGVTPAAIAAMNQSSDRRRGVPLAAPADAADVAAPQGQSGNSFNPDKGMEDILAQAKAFQEENFSNLPNYGPPGSEKKDEKRPSRSDLGPEGTEPRDPTGERPSGFELLAENIKKAPSFNKYSVSRMPNYGPPGSERQDDTSWKERLGYGLLKGTPIAETFAGVGNAPEWLEKAFSLERADTEKRDPSGETTKETTPATTPNNVVKEPNSTADDPRSPGGFGAMSPYETELMNMLKSKEKQAEKDKWMSLAKAGLAMMSSKSPNFGVAFGEGATFGLEDYQAQKSQYETDRLALLGGIEKSRLGREAAARASQGKPDALSMNSLYTGLQNQLEAQARIMSDSMDPDVKAAAMAEMKNIRARMSRIEATAGLPDFVAG